MRKRVAATNANSEPGQVEAGTDVEVKRTFEVTT